MPYANEHSCDLSSKNFDTYRRVNCDQKHDGKCIDTVYGITGSGKDRKSEISSLRYKTSIWTETDAKSHCKSRKGKFEAAKKEKKSAKEILDRMITERIGGAK